jgi:hypothetical protein
VSEFGWKGGSIICFWNWIKRMINHRSLNLFQKENQSKESEFVSKGGLMIKMWTCFKEWSIMIIRIWTCFKRNIYDMDLNSLQMEDRLSESEIWSQGGLIIWVWIWVKMKINHQRLNFDKRGGSIMGVWIRFKRRIDHKSLNLFERQDVL